MDFKNLLNNILAGYIGYVILANLYSIVFLLFAIPLGIDFVRHFYWLFVVINVVVLIVGLIVGFRSRINKTIWYKVFIPTKQNMILSLILSSLFSLSALLVLGPNTFYLFNLQYSIFLSLPFLALQYAIIYFPFSALIYYAYKKRKTKSFKKIRSFVILLLVLLNPIIVTPSTSFGQMLMISASNEPCGVIVTEVFTNSPAQHGGLHVNEVIIEMDQNLILTIQDLQNFMATITSPTKIQVKTDQGIHPIIVQYNEEQQKYVLGAKLLQKTCPR